MRKKGWKEWRWINKSLADLMGRTLVEVATMKKHHRACLEWPCWLVGGTHPSSVNHGDQQPLQVYNRLQCQVSSQLLLVFVFNPKYDIYMGFLIIGNLCKMSAKSNLKWKFASELISFEYCWFNNAFKWYFPLRDQTPNVYINHYI